MMQKLIDLIDVKSIVTILLTIVFCYLSVIGTVNAEMFLTIFTVIISFYFGTVYQKKQDSNARN